MGWIDCSHVNSTIWSSSYLILVTSGSVDPLSCQFTNTFQVLALGFMVGCTFAPNLKTFAGENIWVQSFKPHFRKLRQLCVA